MNKFNVDINAVIIKPLYMGMLINIFFPMTLLIIAYLLSQSSGQDVMEMSSKWDVLAWVLLAVAVADGVIAIIMKHKQFMVPLIRSETTFEEDLKAAAFRISITCYAMTTAIAVYGFVLFLISGDFRTMFLFILMSFIAFQIVKPRRGFIEKVIEVQERHLSEGRRLGGSVGTD